MNSKKNTLRFILHCQLMKTEHEKKITKVSREERHNAKNNEISYQQQRSPKYNKVTSYNYCKQTRFLYPVKISCKYVEEIKAFSDRQKLKVFAPRRPTPQKTLGKDKEMIQCGILYL